ncbi:alpha/beta hydrolase domain-containing protein 17C-like [Argiope bruennichi]|uniref:Alpha/beta hydrolase domain-containing n=1 Tax=Argiope bruennichi TaxID=94029 RepID=A0A8T0FFC9_ARGBR|nr:alpha/beta hydrolase domain-containing protein 17C-like [Argiope bruennichi]KAF8789052.1 Alpha/beta hydrolase domain-containing [Argiope bruennichi]
MSYPTKGLSIVDFCWVFCCPPFPRSITEKIAFMPPLPTYEVAPTQSETIQYAFHLSPDYDTSGLRKVIQQEVRVVKTTLDSDVVVLYVKGTTKTKFTILYSHGNAVDVGLIHRLCVDLSQMTGCDVVTYDYSGYGQSSGKPSERNMFADIKAAWDYTLAFHEPDPRMVILYGHSLGAVATIDLASKVDCAGVILQAPFSSSFQVVCPNRKWFSWLDTLKRY